MNAYQETDAAYFKKEDDDYKHEQTLESKIDDICMEIWGGKTRGEYALEDVVIEDVDSFASVIVEIVKTVKFSPKVDELSALLREKLEEVAERIAANEIEEEAKEIEEVEA